jgi:cytochrome c biogenesis protein CcdA
VNPLDPNSYINELNRLVESLPVAYAFGAGMVASVNPCGFMMLPSFAAYSLSGGKQGNPGGLIDVSWTDRGLRALYMSGLVTLGFMLVFGAIGVVVSAGGRGLLQLFPWSSLVIGSGLILLGLWLLLPGKHLVFTPATRVALPEGNSLGGMFAFGVAYGIASLGCTLPIFLIVVGSALSREGFLFSVLQFLNYALGMGLVITVVAVSVAFFQGALDRPLRRVMPYVEDIGALFLIGAGIYLVYYWFQYGRLLV